MNVSNKEIFSPGTSNEASMVAHICLFSNGEEVVPTFLEYRENK